MSFPYIPVGQLPDKMSPAEIDEVVNRVLRGCYGDGDERRIRLGQWYAIIQSRVNNARLSYSTPVLVDVYGDPVGW